MDSKDYGVLHPAWAGTQAAGIASDAGFVQAMLDVEAAWVRVQAEAGMCPQDAARAVDAVADVSRYDLTALASKTPDGANALIPLLGMMRQLLEQDGATDAAAGALHRGATSQDIIDSALMLTARRTIQALRPDLGRAAAALGALAETHRETLCVARSLTQHALPTTFGLRCANWLSALTAAGRRLDRVALPLQWGGAVGTLASLEQFLDSRTGARTDSRHLSAALAGELGLVDPGAPWHTNRIPVAELGSALAAVVAALGTLGADVLTASRPEIAELSEPREAGKGGSSAMPQKQNPVHSVLLRNAAFSAPGHVATLFTAAGTAVDERPDGGWHSEWAALRELLRLASGAAAHAIALAEGLGVHPENLRRNLELSGDAVLSERIATVLAPLFPGGKKAIQKLVVESLSGSTPLRELLRAQLPASDFSDAQLKDLLDPAGYLGSANRFIDNALAEHTAWKETWQSLR